MPAEKDRPLLFGRLEREFIIYPDGRVVLDRPGGNLLYAAAGLYLWGHRPSLFSRVSHEFPVGWFEDLKERGFDTRGIIRLESSLRHARFVVYGDDGEVAGAKPIPYFAKLGLPLPKVLLDHTPQTGKLDNRRERSADTLRSSDIPDSYADAKGAHLCPLDYLSHSILPSRLHQLGIESITLDAGRGYMHPDFWNFLPLLVNGLSCFQANEGQMRTIFSNRTEDLWKMAEWIGNLNCRSVVIKRGERGQLIYDAETASRYHVPAYPTQTQEALGTGSSYAGGFLAGWLASGDVLEAALYGGVSASLAVEGSGANYVLDSSQDLAEARLSSLRDAVQQH